MVAGGRGYPAAAGHRYFSPGHPNVFVLRVIRTPLSSATGFT
jgi:hypothetical protein